MTFRLDNILEDWATLYKPLSHSKDKDIKTTRFFRVKTVTTDNEWLRNLTLIKSPCLLYQVMIDAQTNGASKSVNYLHTLYFAAKATAHTLAKNAKQDDDCATDQQQAMDDMAQDLLAYLHEISRTGKDPITGTSFDGPTAVALRGLQLDKAEWASIPVKYNEWHLLGITIEQITPRLLCVNKERYHLPTITDTSTTDTSTTDATSH